MKALISPMEVRLGFYRVAQFDSDGFEVADPMFWIDCEPLLVSSNLWYDPSDGQLKELPLEQLPAGSDDLQLVYGP